MDDATAFRQASAGFVQRAEHVRDDQWSAPTPCAEWNVRALVNHIAGEYLWMPELIAGKTIADIGDRFDGDVLGDHPVTALAAAQQAAVAALDDSDALTRTVHLSFGDLPALAYVKQMAVDSVIHAWDLARGTGGDETLDPELVTMAYEELEQTAEDWRSGGAFGAATAAKDGSNSGEAPRSLRSLALCRSLDPAGEPASGVAAPRVACHLVARDLRMSAIVDICPIESPRPAPTPRSPLS